MELPKRARTVNWESGVLTLDGEKQFEVPELTVEIMEQLAGYTTINPCESVGGGCVAFSVLSRS